MVAIARPAPWQPRAMPVWLRPWLRAKIYVGGLIVLGLVLMGVLGPALAPYDPNEQQLGDARLAPQWLAGPHLLGTDNLGRDMQSRLMHGARVSLSVAVAIVIIAGIFGVTMGTLSGYFGGRVDFLIQKLVEVIWAFPPLLLAIAILAFLG